MSDEWPKPIPAPDVVQRLIENAGGRLEECAALPDGSGFALMSMPLPTNHWSLIAGDNISPMPFRLGSREEVVIRCFPNNEENSRSCQLTRQEFAEKIREAGRYAYRASTMNGKDPDLDPDALLQNLIVGFLGYWTESGLSDEDWENPPQPKP